MRTKKIIGWAMIMISSMFISVLVAALIGWADYIIAIGVSLILIGGIKLVSGDADEN